MGEWLSSIAMALAQALHPRLGRNSLLHSLDRELVQIIVEKVRKNAGIEQWKYIQEEQALVSITTFRHMNLQTTMQFAHSRSSGFWFRENDSHVTSFTEYGEIFMERFPSPQSVDSILNYGQQITPEVLVCGSWRVSIQGPNISISHVEYPDLRITLDGDGFSCVPQSRSSVLLLGLPKANGIKVQQASPPIPIEC